MTKKEKLQWLQKRFDVSILNAHTIRAQRNGLIVTGTILQVYDELKIFKRTRKTEDTVS